ncbi:MAG: ferrochelatase [Legionellales bacterium]|jgi:protoporphyrin/coproporphyrin ferrochelatase|nr:ferrochelatase [Legionellales bacterium]
MKIGVLLVNLGTPSDINIASVRAYLREFLADPRVVDLPFFVRYLLLYAVILPFRPKQSFEAYKKIWLPSGSPLMVHSENVAQKVSDSLGDNYKVVLAMRYGAPSIRESLEQLNDCDKIVVQPLFPQYASATTGSIVEKVYKLIQDKNYITPINVLPEFYADDGFISAYTATVNKALKGKKIDKIIFSFHGLPVRHITKSGCQYLCKELSPCPLIGANNKTCYRAQCYATARLIAKKLGLTDEYYKVSFQSRLGSTPWIQPYTDNVINELALDERVRDIAVVCPSFVVDCLETLEEVGIQAKSQWHALGGRGFVLIPCINDNEIWIKALVDIIKAS